MATFACLIILLLALLFGAPSAARAAVASVTLNATTIAGGSGGLSTGTVTLSGPAPAGGQVITLRSSNTDLAASALSIVVPEGAMSASFTVGTNPLYRPNSGLAFDVTITGSDSASSASAILHVTAQAIRALSGSSSPPRLSTGTICTGTTSGGAIGGEPGTLYDCRLSPGVNNNFPICTFRQECPVGCMGVPTLNPLNRKDVCFTTPPIPAAVNPEIIEGGHRAAGAVVLDRPAASPTTAFLHTVVPRSPDGGFGGHILDISPEVHVEIGVRVGGIPIPPGATTAPFEIDTVEVAVPMFVPIGLGFDALDRAYRNSFVAVVPAAGSAPPSGPLAVYSVNLGGSVVVGADIVFGTVILNGVAPSGGAVVSLGSDDPAAIVPSTVTVPAGLAATDFSYQVAGVTVETPVTITAGLGGECRGAAMTIFPFISTTTPAALFDLTIPATVIAGSRSTGRVTLTSAAPGFPADFVTVALTSDNEAAVIVPRTITVVRGATIQGFTIRAFPVATSTPVTITATFNGVTRSATLTVNPPGSALPDPSAICLNPTALIGGNVSTGIVSLDRAAPAGGVAVTLSTNNTVASVPATVTVPAGQMSATFQVSTTAVTTPTVITLSASAGAVTKSATLTANPVPPAPLLSAVSINPTSVVGGNPSTGTITLGAPAPSGGAVVFLATALPAGVPATVAVPAGATSATFTVTTSSVASVTVVTITASFGGASRTAVLTVNPPPPIPSAPSLLSPADQATVAQPILFDWTDAANAVAYEIQITSASTFTALGVSASQATVSGLPAQQLIWRVRGINSAGVAGPFSASRRVTPQAAPAAATLSAVSVNPASVVGGTGASGTVTLTSAAPSGGFLVTLSSSNTTVASVPASVTVAAGATSASFAVTTSAVAGSTAVTITGTGGGVTRTALLTVNPVVACTPTTCAAQGKNCGTIADGCGGTLTCGVCTAPQTCAGGGVANVCGLSTASTALLTVTATGRAGESVSSSPAGLTVNVGTTGSASFTTGTSVTLTVSNGRTAIWSGGCSSGGAKVKTCSFTINAATSVTANVQ